MTRRGRSAGARRGMVQIGAASRILGGTDNEDDVLYVTATLPGVYTAVQIRASVGPLAIQSRGANRTHPLRTHSQQIVEDGDIMRGKVPD